MVSTKANGKILENNKNKTSNFFYYASNNNKFVQPLNFFGDSRYPLEVNARSRAQIKLKKYFASCVI